MDRVRGLASFALVAASVLMALRLLHTSVPFVFPSTQQGPVVISRLEDVRSQLGFSAILPAYRPAMLGESPESMTVQFSPAPTFAIVWRGGGHFLSITQRRGGRPPRRPPLSAAVPGLEGSSWWTDESGNHAVIARNEFWITIDTDRPRNELRRFAETLTPY